MIQGTKFDLMRVKKSQTTVPLGRCSTWMTMCCVGWYLEVGENYNFPAEGLHKCPGELKII
jgi:hypothetical protein